MAYNIEATHIIDSGILAFLTPYSGDFILNGTKLPNNKKCIINYEDRDNVKALNKSSIVSHYESSGFCLSVIDYNKETSLLYKANKDDDWDSLDDEFAYRKFVETWKPVYLEISSESPVTFNITGVTYDTKSKYITSLWNHSSVLEKDRLYQLNICQLEVDAIKEQCNKYNLKLEVPTHSHLRFAKIEDNYCFGEVYDRRRPLEYGNLDYLHEEQKKYSDAIQQIVLVALAKKTQSMNLNLGQFIDELKSIAAKCSKIKCTSKSVVTGYDIQGQLEYLIDKVEATAIKNLTN